MRYLVRNVHELRRRFGLSLQLDLDGSLIGFARPQDFEFALAGRTAVPRRRVEQLLGSDTPTLVRETTALRNIEQRLVDALDASLQGRRSLHDSLAELGTAMFARELSWRGVFEGLAGLGREVELFRRIAVAKYLQFIAAQQQTIGLLLRHRGTDRTAVRGLEDTLCLEPETVAALADVGENMTRLPRGEPREVLLPRGASVPLRLGDRAFSLIAGSPITLVDAGGRVYGLPSGPSGVGREGRNAVVLDTAYRTVSRRHLVVEVLGPDSLRLTDLSSHGTWLPRSCLRP